MNTQIHATESHTGTLDHCDELPKAKGGLPWLGHLVPFFKHPYELLMDLAQTHGDIVSFHLLGQKFVLLTGAEASEPLYLSEEDLVDQSPYRNVLEPVYGEGVLYATTHERKNEQLRVITPALRMEAMRHHTQTIAVEVDAAIADLGESGDINLLDFMRQLMVNTSSHCLFGKEFRYEFCDEFNRNYQELALGVTPIAYVFPHLPIARFRQRDRALLRLRALVKKVIEIRRNQSDTPQDLLQHLLDTRYTDGSKLTANEITGLLIAAFMAGHHTTAGTAAWTLIELLRHPQVLHKIHGELTRLPSSHDEAFFEALRDMPHLENTVKEALRLHAPVLLIMRKVLRDFRFRQYTIKAGTFLLSSPPVTHCLARHFPDPLTFDPSRYESPSRQDRTLAYHPFGGGRHKCRGNVFAIMHIKAILATLLQRYDFELADAPEAYVDDYTSGIGVPIAPCRIRYRTRPTLRSATSVHQDASLKAGMAGCPYHP
jgi:sterol 14-demethylase